MVRTFAEYQYQGRLSKFNKMTITVKYFGLIADVTKTREEVFTIDTLNFSTDDLLKNLQQKYKDLNGNSFVIAVNKTVATENLSISNNDTIALLPPFAGG